MVPKVHLPSPSKTTSWLEMLAPNAALWTCSYTKRSKGRFDPLNQGRKLTTLQESSGRDDKGCGDSVRRCGQHRSDTSKLMGHRLLWVAAKAIG